MVMAIGFGLNTAVVKPAVLLSSPVVVVKKFPTVYFLAKSGARVVVRAAARTAASTSAEPGKRGILKPQPISPTLQAFLGVPEISRAEAIKLIWAYIKTNNLQDPDNKKVILCDEKLKVVFGKDRVGMLEVSGLISPHMLKSQG